MLALLFEVLGPLLRLSRNTAGPGAIVGINISLLLLNYLAAVRHHFR
ncbi:MAG: hypothetical protein WB789_00540 [Thermoplasmata archaeon]